MSEREESYKSERRKRDSNDRKTIGSVMDKKTRLIIDKLLVQGVLKEVYGVVSVGKEASIYLGVASPTIYSRMCLQQDWPTEDISVVLKIYKTSTMVFKDRERYIIGERRFRRYSKGNSRKLVKLWAEKEVRNLNRLQKKGIPSPKPLFLRRNILIMTMIGEDPNPTLLSQSSNPNLSTTNSEDDQAMSQDQIDENSLASDVMSGDSDSSDSSNDESDDSGDDSDDNSDSSEGSDDESGDSDDESDDSTSAAWQTVSAGGMGGIAPNLKDARLHGEQLQDAYNQVVSLLCRLYNDCGLVHADLSEYNMLYWHSTVYLIDVSQSVEWDHPNAREFLEMDINNVNAFFTKEGANTLPFDELLNTILNAPTTNRSSPSSSSEEENVSNDSITSSSSPASSIQNNSPETSQDRKARKKEAKEAQREKRRQKISKKDKKKLSRKIRIAKSHK
ncbi:RIO kinase 1 [Nematocida homosporus]|uniref:RIO kinase 1 n=1 Tax=Nematocida homosporus TaxID=1912981 RepID=UPI00221FE6E7|nr:RIO kinase 1 [Nematocida homosporus]KAI5185228.1 RIO kinase 1 [Nematocida homosporus]